VHAGNKIRASKKKIGLTYFSIENFLSKAKRVKEKFGALN
jgi:hypothetical protein